VREWNSGGNSPYERGKTGKRGFKRGKQDFLSRFESTRVRKMEGTKEGRRGGRNVIIEAGRRSPRRLKWRLG